MKKLRLAKKTKKVGIVIATNDPETCWVAIRYASFHLAEKNDTNIFFVDSGLKYQDMCNEKYDFIKLLEDFIQAGGNIYTCANRELLKTHLKELFLPMLSMEDINSICDNDIFQSMMTENAYIREFKRVL